MSPEKENNNESRKRLREDLFNNESAHVPGLGVSREEIDALEKPLDLVDTSELVVEQEDYPNSSPEQKVKPGFPNQRSEKEIIAARREIVDAGVNKIILGKKMIKFVVGSKDTKGSGTYSRITEKFWDNYDVKNEN